MKTRFRPAGRTKTLRLAGCGLAWLALLLVSPAGAQRRAAPLPSLPPSTLSGPGYGSGLLPADTVPADSSVRHPAGERIAVRAILGSVGWLAGAVVGLATGVLLGENSGEGEYSGLAAGAVVGLAGGAVGASLGAAVPGAGGSPCRTFRQRAGRAFLGAATGTAAGFLLTAVTETDGVAVAIPVGTVIGGVIGAEC